MFECGKRADGARERASAEKKSRKVEEKSRKVSKVIEKLMKDPGNLRELSFPAGGGKKSFPHGTELGHPFVPF